jgi:predicted DNA-binding transcriptional regulator AlpA
MDDRMDPETAYQTPRQFTRTTGIPESTLAKMRMRGGGPPYVKIGRSVRYSVSLGLAWMEAHTRRNTSECPPSERYFRNKRRRTLTTASTPAAC